MTERAHDTSRHHLQIIGRREKQSKPGFNKSGTVIKINRASDPVYKKGAGEEKNVNRETRTNDWNLPPQPEGYIKYSNHDLL